MKICCRCNVSKDDVCFSKDKTRKDGKFKYCKECHHAIYLEDRTNVIIRVHSYRKKHLPEIKIRKAAYYSLNAENISIKSKRYRIKSSAKIKVRESNYRKENKHTTNFKKAE